MEQRQTWEANISSDAEEIPIFPLYGSWSFITTLKARKIYSLESKVFGFDVHNKWAMDHVGAFQPTASQFSLSPA
jgi:hypothetical protein